MKDIPNQGLVCFVSYGSFFCLSFGMYVVFCFVGFARHSKAADDRCGWIAIAMYCEVEDSLDYMDLE